MTRLRPAVFLDRDGTLNLPVVRDGNPFPPATGAEFRLYDGVPAACRQLHAAGFVLVVATNQPDVGRGTQLQSTVEAMHAHLLTLIPEIARLEVCYDAGGESPPSEFHKPAPGMLRRAATALDYLDYSYVGADRSFGSYPNGQSIHRQSFHFPTPSAANNPASAL